MSKVILIIMQLLKVLGKFDISLDYEDGKIKVCLIIDPNMIKDK